MALDSYRKWLISIWGVGFLIPFILILLQFAGGKYGDNLSEVLGWLTALTLSTILLMIGIMVSAQTPPLNGNDETGDKPDAEKTDEEKTKEQAAKDKAAHDKFIFQLTVGFSVVYLLIINLVFFLEPFSESKPLELMRNSKIFLAVPDSFISLLIGYFFGKK